MTKIERKKSKNYFWVRLSETNNDFKLHKKSRKKNRKIIFGSELSEANNEPTFRLHQKVTYMITEYFMNIYPISNFAPFPTAFCFTKINKKGLRRPHN